MESLCTRYVIQLSTVCSDERAGEESLQAATDALFHRDGTDQDSSSESNKPKLLWCAFFIQEAFKATEVLTTPLSVFGRNAGGNILNELFTLGLPTQRKCPVIIMISVVQSCSWYLIAKVVCAHLIFCR